MNEFRTDGIRPVQRQRASRAIDEVPPKQKRKLRAEWVFVLGVISLTVVVVAGLLIYKSQKTDLTNVITVKRLVGRHVVLPDIEEPVLATITDKSKVSTPFLQQAENGDKVLIYQKAKKVILYRPSTDRVVDMGPVTIAPLEGNSRQ